MPVTSPDSIFYRNTATAAALEAESATQATSIQTALTARFAALPIHTFSWADASARAGATGMVEGDIGIQKDTNVYYWYSGTAWLQQTRVHGEYTYSISVPNAASTLIATPTLDAANSSAAAATFFTPIAGGLTLLLAGDYFAFGTMLMPGLPTTGRSFMDINTPAIYRTGIVVGEDRAAGSVSYRNAAASTNLTMNIYQTSGATRVITGRIHVDYLGFGA